MTDRMIGLAIGRFVVRSKLAEGGMGAVYLAVHERLGVRKVVKVLLGEYAQNPIIRRRFEREATAASRLHHRHVIRIDDFGALPDGQLFLMMPFLDGETLEAHLRHTRPSLPHACHVLVQLCAALQHLHEAGIVHRDLKPGNVFLSATAENPFEVVLIDLGIARDRTSQTASFPTQSGIALGTPGYMAVEQYGHAATADARADVYATAVIAWEMLTGHLPWGIHDARVLHLKQMTEPPRLPEGSALPAEIIALLVASLAADPAARPRSARDFAVEFAAAVPAAGPREPSGADILLRFARDFIERAPADGATVRCAAATPLPASAHTLAARPVETTLGAATGATDPTPVAPCPTGARTTHLRRGLSLAIAGALTASVCVVLALRPRAEATASAVAPSRAAADTPGDADPPARRAPTSPSIAVSGVPATAPPSAAPSAAATTSARSDIRSGVASSPTSAAAETAPVRTAPRTTARMRGSSSTDGAAVAATPQARTAEPAKASSSHATPRVAAEAPVPPRPDGKSAPTPAAAAPARRVFDPDAVEE